jgi:hypothetical protein
MVLTTARLTKTRVAVAIAVIGVFLLLYVNRVVRNVTEEDGLYISLIMGEKPVPSTAKNLSYPEQIEFIRKVQMSVLDVANVQKGIPYGRTRDPKDLYEARHGLCFDRSWVIEKILIANGFDVRHVSLYSTKGRWVPSIVLAIPGVASHALSEVRTRRGWLVVDSNRTWMSVDLQGEPVPISQMQKIGALSIEWDRDQTDAIAPIFKGTFIYVYGLYSRHGYFFPPFVPIPDLYWEELLANFLPTREIDSQR